MEQNRELANPVTGSVAPTGTPPSNERGGDHNRGTPLDGPWTQTFTGPYDEFRIGPPLRYVVGTARSMKSVCPVRGPRAWPVNPDWDSGRATLAEPSWRLPSFTTVRRRRMLPVWLSLRPTWARTVVSSVPR